MTQYQLPLAVLLIATSSPLRAMTVLAPTEDAMTSAFFQGTDLVRGYAGDNRPTFRVSSNNAFGTGPETVYLAFDGSDFTSRTEPVTQAILSISSADGNFGANAGPGNPFQVSAHGVDANPFTSIIDDTNSSGTIQWLDFFNNNILTASDTVAVDSFGLINFDVTSLVNDWISGSNSEFAIALTGKDDVQSGNGFLHGFLNNNENPGATFLTLNPVPEPSSALLSILALSLGVLRRSRA